VNAYDRQRDKIANQIAKLWIEERDRIAKVKANTLAAIEKLQAAAGKETGVDLGGAKATCSSAASTAPSPCRSTASTAPSSTNDSRPHSS
jgi:hypothetical protein